ncbi:hypothetical protein HE1_00747 [Holospora elegans E1]|uniref:Uncharacterized protein n=1 Tax=Holospora elegans E1 TaxID=1427503 RepID=A0A023DYB9_9PROT|nr:hypothetical protein [Holospora elegans]GAJ46414.1 hypothetical protein HE1_00747 [Holospora elegans E1]
MEVLEIKTAFSNSEIKKNFKSGALLSQKIYSNEEKKCLESYIRDLEKELSLIRQSLYQETSLALRKKIKQRIRILKIKLKQAKKKLLSRKGGIIFSEPEKYFDFRIENFSKEENFSEKESRQYIQYLEKLEKTNRLIDFSNQKIKEIKNKINVINAEINFPETNVTETNLEKLQEQVRHLNKELEEENRLLKTYDRRNLFQEDY